MIIYGVALLAFCFLTGKIVGSYIGALIGVEGDVGGVGFAMLLLMVLSMYLKKRGWLGEESIKGMAFWNAMYLPIIVAMASTQNVKAAVSSGPIALFVGAGATLAGFLLVPLFSKIGRSQEHN